MIDCTAATIYKLLSICYTSLIPSFVDETTCTHHTQQDTPTEDWHGIPRYPPVFTTFSSTPF